MFGCDVCDLTLEVGADYSVLMRQYPGRVGVCDVAVWLMQHARRERYPVDAFVRAFKC